MMRYINQTIMYDDTEDMPAPHNTAPLENAPPTLSIPKHNGEASIKYSVNSTLNVI